MLSHRSPPSLISFRCSFEEGLGPYLAIKHTAKTPLGRFPVWYESSLGAQVILLVWSCFGSFCLDYSKCPKGHEYPGRHHFLKYKNNLSLWQDMRPNQWTLKYRSLTHIYFRRSIFVSYWSINQNTIFLQPGTVARSEACPLGMQAAPSSILTSGTFFRVDLVMKKFPRPFSLFRWFKKSSCQSLAKECALITGKLAEEQYG